MTLKEARDYRHSSDPRVRQRALLVLSNRRRKSARHAPTKAAKKAKGTRQRESWRSIKEKVRQRSEGFCELHLCAQGKRVAGEDFHHVISGPLKRKYEAADTVLCLCRDCHDRITANDPDALYDCLCPALEEVLSPRALDGVSRRLGKIERTRVVLSRDPSPHSP